MRLLFVDTNSATPYDMATLDACSPGGTITAMMLVAQALSREHEVLVAEGALDADDRSDPRLGYVTLDTARNLGAEAPDAIIVMRKHRVVPEFARRYPNARMVLWLANFQPPEVMYKRRWLVTSGCVVVAMSRAHRDQAAKRLNHPLGKYLSWPWCDLDVQYIYNPIPEDLNPDDTPVNMNKVIVFSTANKGLPETLALFERARQEIPELELYVAGSKPENMRAYPKLRRYAEPRPGVHMLGRLPQSEVWQHVRESLCVFYPQYVYPETFGLVYAEANAVGTPMIAHDFGAAREVLSDPVQLVDGRDAEAVVRKLVDWRNGQRPVVRAREELRISNIARDWNTLLADVPAQRGT